MAPVFPARAARALALAAAALGFGTASSGCALQVQSGIDRTADVARYALHYDHPEGAEANLIDRALARCGAKTAAAETACVKAAVAGSGLTPQGLAALVPGCRTGIVCHYDHATRDRLGFVSAMATDFVRRWRVDLDLRAPSPDIGRVPVTVYDRDDFDAARPPG